MALGFLNASSQYVNCGSSSLFDVGSADFCVMCWFNVTSSGDYIVSKGRFSTIGPGWGLRRDTGGLNQLLGVFGDGSGGFDIVQTAGAISTGVWHHAAIVRDGGAGLYRLYLDGVEVDTTAISAASGSLNNSNDFLIGAVEEPAGTPTRFMDGLIDDVRFYPNLVSAAEIKTIHAVRGPDGIVAPTRYPLNEGAPGVAASGAGVIKDVGANQLNGTPVASPVWAESQLRFRKRAG